MSLVRFQALTHEPSPSNSETLSLLHNKSCRVRWGRQPSTTTRKSRRATTILSSAAILRWKPLGDRASVEAEKTGLALILAWSDSLALNVVFLTYLIVYAVFNHRYITKSLPGGI